MAQSQLFLGLIFATLLGAAPQEEKKPSLPNPFTLKREETMSGNPLATYAELIAMEKQYVADEMMRSAYWQVRGTVAAYLGDTKEADLDWNTSFPAYGQGQVLLDT